MTEPNSSNDDTRSAEELLREFLGADHADPLSEFEEMCSTQGHLAAELRRLYRVHVNREGSFSFYKSRGEKADPLTEDGARKGETIGDFKLLARIAAGGQGEVWEAQQLSLNRRVALKLIRPERINERTLALFAREARAGGRLAHPGIVAVHDYGEDEGRHWISQELVEGAWTLHDFIDEMRNAEDLPSNYYESVAGFLSMLADALQTAHDAGIIHRDVKPRNVLVTENDKPKLTDFGLARIIDETAVSITGDFAGSWLYMSPEQVTAKRIEVDHRTDVFSLGVVMYEMLALQRPFEGDTTHQIAEKIVYWEPPDLMKIRSKVPRELSVICGKALEKRKDERYATMTEFAADLRRWIGNEPIHATPPTLVDRGLKWCKRNPTPTAALAVASVALVVISYLLVSNVQTTDELSETVESLEVKTKEAKDNARRADENAAEASRQRKSALSLLAPQEIDYLVDDASKLWPPHPGLIEELEHWWTRATNLEEGLEVEDEGYGGYLARLKEVRSRGELVKSSKPEEWRFDDRGDGLWSDYLLNLIAGIRRLHDEKDGLAGTGFFLNGSDRRAGWSVGRRIINAKNLERTFAPEGIYRKRWEESLPFILESYKDYLSDLKIQMGLVPIGQDSSSGLWEFWHVLSGDEPLRDEEGELQLTEKTGVVLILLPGGVYARGSQNTDVGGRNFDPMTGAAESVLREVTLSPFFISKYEFTQGQWLNLRGDNPSQHTPETYSKNWDAGGNGSSLIHPVENVTSAESQELLNHFGMSLPTEAQWEYSARGGTETPWWTGPTTGSLSDYANLADSFAKTNGGGQWEAFDLELYDGYLVHAPVNALLPNPFGLHNVNGNVFEFTLDGFKIPNDTYFFYRDGNIINPISTDFDGGYCVTRGGSFRFSSTYARSSARNVQVKSLADESFGFRPARQLDQ